MEHKHILNRLGSRSLRIFNINVRNLKGRIGLGSLVEQHEPVSIKNIKKLEIPVLQLSQVPYNQLNNICHLIIYFTG